MAHSTHILTTLILLIGHNQGALEPQDSCNINNINNTVQLGDNETDMQFTAFKVLEDSVVFDWFITLEQKESMCECELSYWPADGNTSTRLETFLPSRRTLVLDTLTCQTEYCVMLACRDGDQRSHSSNIVSVTTGNCSLWRHLPSTRHSSSSSDFTFRFIRSSHVRSSVSPHAVLGFCTSILLVSVLVTTTVLVYRKYVRHERLMSSLDNESQEEEVEEGHQVHSISLQCNCQDLEKDNTSSDTLEQSLIEF